MNFGEKIKSIRTTEGYTQEEFSASIGCGLSTLGHYEAGRAKATQDVLSSLCKKFPEYTLWLMTGQTQPPQQISPEMATQDTAIADAVAGVS